MDPTACSLILWEFTPGWVQVVLVPHGQTFRTRFLRERFIQEWRFSWSQFPRGLDSSEPDFLQMSYSRTRSLGLYCSIPDVDQSSIHHQPLAAGRYSVSTGHWQDAGHHSVYGTIGSQRTSQVLAYLMVGQWRLGSDIRKLGSGYYSTRLGHPQPVLVGITFGISITVSQGPRHRFHHVYRCVHRWMGGSTGWPQYRWTVVQSATSEPH